MAKLTRQSDIQEVYLNIPPEFNRIYNKLLVYLVDFGLDLVKDCNAGCNAANKKVLDCWNMFQSAIAAYNLAAVKDSTDRYYRISKFIIKYIEAQIDDTYKKSDIEPQPEPEPEPEPTPDPEPEPEPEPEPIVIPGVPILWAEGTNFVDDGFTSIDVDWQAEGLTQFYIYGAISGDKEGYIDFAFSDEDYHADLVRRTITVKEGKPNYTVIKLKKDLDIDSRINDVYEYPYYAAAYLEGESVPSKVIYGVLEICVVQDEMYCLITTDGDVNKIYTDPTETKTIKFTDKITRYIHFIPSEARDFDLSVRVNTAGASGFPAFKHYSLHADANNSAKLEFTLSDIGVVHQTGQFYYVTIEAAAQGINGLAVGESHMVIYIEDEEPEVVTPKVFATNSKGSDIFELGLDEEFTINCDVLPDQTCGYWAEIKVDGYEPDIPIKKHKGHLEGVTDRLACSFDIIGLNARVGETYTMHVIFNIDGQTETSEYTYTITVPTPPDVRKEYEFGGHGNFGIRLDSFTAENKVTLIKNIQEALNNLMVDSCHITLPQAKDLVEHTLPYEFWRFETYEEADAVKYAILAANGTATINHY